MAPKVFVSYAREDQEFARKLAKDLRQQKIDIWLDQIDIRAGELWDQAVEAALTNSSAVVVVLTPASVASRMVLDEVLYALEENKLVTPVLYKACVIPFRLRRLHYVDFTSDYAEGLAGLTRALEPFKVDSSAPPSPPHVQVSSPTAPNGLRATGSHAGSLELQMQQLIMEQLGVSAEEVVPEAHFAEDLGADSLDLVELVMAGEELFGVEVSDDEAERIKTVGDAIAAIDKRRRLK